MMKFIFTGLGPRELRGLDKDGVPKWYRLNTGDSFFADFDWSLKRDYDLAEDTPPVTEERDDWTAIRAMDFDDAKALTGMKARSWADLESKWRAR